jgi:hypothetical protein
MTEVVLEEIPLGDSSLIFAKLMERQECNRVAMQYIRAGGYVCQGQKILHATAEFKLDRDVQNKIATKAKVTTDEIRDLVKGAVEAQSEHSVVERGGRLVSGAALNYGVSMNPMCLAPVDGHFARILPRTTFERVVNFVLFNIIEPMLPKPKDDPTHVAQNAR